MKFLQDDQLSQWTSALTEVTIGHSRILYGRLEVYSMKRVSSDKKYAAILGEKYVKEIHQDQEMAAELQQTITTARPNTGRKRSQSTGFLEESMLVTSALPAAPPKKRARSCSWDDPRMSERSMSMTTTATSSLGDFHEQGTRRLMTDLVLTLNASFPDYDFAASKPCDFTKLTVKKALNRINESLSEWAAEHNHNLNQLWLSVHQSINLKECDVYKFSSPEDTSFLLGGTTTTTTDTDDLDVMVSSSHYDQDKEDSLSSCPETAVLWSFYYLFVNKHKKRILLFTCAESMRRALVRNRNAESGDYDEGDEVVVERFVQNEDAASTADTLDFDWDPESNRAGGIPVSTV